jgi:two-component system chemotaxis response regulator CheB
MLLPAPGGRARDIRVLIVDDSPLAVEILRRMLSTAPEMLVAGIASNGAEALKLIPQVRPDVICTDMHMPKMGGLEMIREVMVRHPLPILVISVSVQEDQKHNIFQMLEAGALDILAKPRGGLQSDFDVTARDLITKIRILSGVKVIGRRRAAAGAAARPLSLKGLAAAPPRIIGIGASTGGPQALENVLRHLSGDFPLPLLCVQHIALGFMGGLVAWLAGRCHIPVRTAQEGVHPLAGTAYFPPDDRHLEIDDAGNFRCSDAVAGSGHKPSIDLAFNSLARHYGAAAVGVLLTGMGVDGADGMLSIARAGGLTIAQDEASSIVFGMPKRAFELGAARRVLALDQIGPALSGLGGADPERKESTWTRNPES